MGDKSGIARRIKRMLSLMASRMIDSHTLRSSSPSAARVTVASLPITRKETCIIISGITGLTLPGMIDEPGCTAGRVTSASPARGPDDIRRRSAANFDRVRAIAFNAAEILTQSSAFCSASKNSPPADKICRSVPTIPRRRSGDRLARRQRQCRRQWRQAAAADKRLPDQTSPPSVAQRRLNNLKTADRK